MSGTPDAAAGPDDARARTAVVETTHADAATAATVAGALAPDNTDEIRTTAEGATVRTRVERETTGGLLATVDDYLVNLAVADDVAAAGREADGDVAVADDGAGDHANETNDADDTDDADGIRGTTATRDTADEADTHDT